MVIQIQGHIFNLDQTAKAEINKESITIYHGSFKDTFWLCDLGQFGFDKLKAFLETVWVQKKFNINDPSTPKKGAA